MGRALSVVVSMPPGTSLERPMSQSAQAIYDHAPLGARISYTDGLPRPPARFKRKLRAWEQQNGTGFLSERRPGYREGDPALFTLRTDVYGSRETIIMIVNLIFNVSSTKEFAVIGEPSPGEILCITVDHEGNDELAYVARTQADADHWLERNRYGTTRLETVPERHAIAA